jgi:hypothetical protein
LARIRNGTVAPGRVDDNVTVVKDWDLVQHVDVLGYLINLHAAPSDKAAAYTQPIQQGQ